MKKIIIAVLTIIMIFSSVALPCNAKHESANLSGRDCAPAVENQGDRDDCLYYAISSTAGSYAKKHYNISNIRANFSENKLKSKIGITDVHNYGEILYKSAECFLDNTFFISSVEILNGRGNRYLQKKISENGAIVAVIALPNSENCMTDNSYYSNEYNSFYCSAENLSQEYYHAISIVGWDDEYKWCSDTDQGLPGAWLCKNSYGTEYGDGGYFWLPYEYEFLYSAAIEVSKAGFFESIVKSNELPKSIGYIYAVNVRAFGNVTEDITVKVGETVAFSEKISLKNGCNLIKFNAPIKTGKVTVKGENISVRADTVICYVSLLKNNYLDIRNPQKDEDWLEKVDSLSINIKSGKYWASAYNEAGKSVAHKIIYNSTNNCFIITPEDGYYFTEDTIIQSLRGFDDVNNIANWKRIYGEMFIKFGCDNSGNKINDFTIGMAVDANYHRLKNGNNEWIKMISFDEGEDGRGRLIVVGHGVGGAKVRGVNIITDENSLFKSAILSFDNGSSLTLKSGDAEIEYSYYSDPELKDEIESAGNLEEYYLKAKIYYSFEEDAEILINGIKNGDVEFTDKNEIVIKIDIPDVEMKRGEKKATILLWISQLLNKLR